MISILIILFAGEPKLIEAANEPIYLTQSEPGNGTTLINVGTNPFYLNQANTEYFLNEDLTFPGTGLVISGTDITLNLNGHTLTYGTNATNTENIPNGSFEAGNLNNWTFNRGGVFEVSAPCGIPMPGDNNCLKATDSTLQVGDFMASDWITLPKADRTYKAGMISKGGEIVLRIDVEERTIGEPDNTAEVIAASGATMRNDHAPMYNVDFNPGDLEAGETPEEITQENIANHEFRIKFHVIRIDSADPFTAYFGHALIKPAYDAGVAITQQGWISSQVFPDLTLASSNSRHFTLHNGTITDSGGFKSYGIAKGNWSRMEMFNVTTNVSGIDGSNFLDTTGIRQDYDPGGYVEIHNNTFNNSAPYVLRRDDLTGFPVILKSYSNFYHNKIDGGQGGVNCASATNIKVYENDAANGGFIKTKQFVTNHYSVETYGGTNIEIYNNDINTNEGDYSGRGIHIGEGSQDIKVHNNNIDVRTHLNTEYNASGSLGAHGIKLELTSNSKVYENNVTVHSTPTTYANALDIEVYPTNTGNEIERNTFVATKEDMSDPAYPQASAFQATTDNLPDYYNNLGGLNIENNTFITNNNMINVPWGGPSNWQMKDNTYACGTSLTARCTEAPDPANFHLIRFANDHNPGANVADVTDVNIINPKLEVNDVFTPKFDNTSYIYSIGGGAGDNYEFLLKQYLNITILDQSGNPISGVSVSADSELENTPPASATNASGQATLTLTQSKIYGTSTNYSSANQTAYSPYTLSVSKDGYENYSQNGISIAGETTLSAITLESVANPPEDDPDPQAEPDSVAPNTPNSFNGTVFSNNRIDLTWSPATDNIGVVGYKIYRNGSYLTSTTSTNYSDTNLTGNTTYNYKISSYDLNNNESIETQEIIFTTLSQSTDDDEPTEQPETDPIVISASDNNTEVNNSDSDSESSEDENQSESPSNEAESEVASNPSTSNLPTAESSIGPDNQDIIKEETKQNPIVQNNTEIKENIIISTTNNILKGAKKQIDQLKNVISENKNSIFVGTATILILLNIFLIFSNTKKFLIKRMTY